MVAITALKTSALLARQVRLISQYTYYYKSWDPWDADGIYINSSKNYICRSIIIIESTKDSSYNYTFAVPGDPVLRVLIDGREVIAREGLVWYYDEQHGWVSVCGDAMGYVEAQVLCNSLQFPYFTFLHSSQQ